MYSLCYKGLSSYSYIHYTLVTKRAATSYLYCFRQMDTIEQRLDSLSFAPAAGVPRSASSTSHSQNDAVTTNTNNNNISEILWVWDRRHYDTTWDRIHSFITLTICRHKRALPHRIGESPVNEEFDILNPSSPVRRTDGKGSEDAQVSGGSKSVRRRLGMFYVLWAEKFQLS